MEKSIVQADKVSLSIRGKTILDSVSFSVKKNDIFALIGHNGAGKSTLIRILLGLELDHKGKIMLFGSSELEKMRMNIGSALDMDNLVLDPKLKGIQYLREMCLLCGAPKSEADEAARLVGAESYAGNKIGTYSFGMKQRIAIAAALIGKPELLILDEPFNGIDPEGMKSMRMLIHSLNRSGVTILLTSHIIPELIKLATRFGVVHSGRYTHETDPGELSAMNIKKYIYRTDDLDLAAHRIDNEYPTLFGIPTGSDRIGIIGETGEKLDSSFVYCGTEKATAEDILLWYMSGKGR